MMSETTLATDMLKGETLDLLCQVLGGEGELKSNMMLALASLTYREREIIKLRYGLVDGHKFSLEETTRVFKVTRERVRQIEAKALRKLRHPTRLRILIGLPPAPINVSHPEAFQLLPSEQRELLLRPCSTLNLSLRAKRALLRLDVDTLGSLVLKSAENILSVKFVGLPTLREIREKLADVGLKLANDP